MRLRYFSVFLFAQLAALAVPADGSAGNVTVTVAAQPDGARIETHVTLHAAAKGGRFLEVSLVNRSEKDVSLERITVAVPWELDEERAMLATGGGCMFATPTYVHPKVSAAPPSTTFLLARQPGGCVFAGFLTWKTFHSQMVYRDHQLVITAEGERRRLPAGVTLVLEKLWLTTGEDWQDLMYAYADEIVRENHIVLRPREPLIGWSNWDYYGGRFTYDQLISNLDQIAAMKVGANIFQIDGGWWSRTGDYLSPRANLPGGMKHLADEIHRRGLVAGIHLDGMRADQDSRVVIEHPEFFLKDQHGRIIGQEPPDSARKRGRVYFDFSHPGARDHMATAIRTLRREWGYDYFKIDFLKFCSPEFIFKDTPGISPETTRIVPFDDALTSVERYHLAMSTFRKAMGDDAYFVACTAEYGPSFGHVDGLRTSGDIDPTYSRFSRSCLENGGAFYMHRKVVLTDTDYIVSRGRLDEDESLTKDPRKTGGDMPFELAEMWAHYVALFGGPKLSSDNLNILRAERKDLFRRAVALPSCDRFVPIDFWQHARNRDDPFCVFLGEAQGRGWLAVFNWSTEPRTFSLGGAISEEKSMLQPVGGHADVTSGDGKVRVALQPRSSAIFQLSPAARFEQLRKTLTVD